MLDYNKTKELYCLLNQYECSELDLFTLFDECVQYFNSIRGVCAWLTCGGKQDFDGYCFDDLKDYYICNS